MVARFSALPIMAICGLLQGCGHVPVASVAALSRVAPLTTVASELRVAMIAPESLKVRDGDGNLHLAFSDPEQALAVEQDFKLEAVPGEAASTGLDRDIEPGMQIRVFRLRPDAAEKFEQARRLVMAHKRKGGKSKGSISVAAGGCLSEDRGQALPVSAYLRTAETGKFIVLFERLDLRKFAAANGGGPIGLCPS